MRANYAELSEKLVASMFEACIARDIDAVMAYFADDAVFDWFNGQRFESKAAIGEAMVTAFAGVEALHQGTGAKVQPPAPGLLPTWWPCPCR